MPVGTVSTRAVLRLKGPELLRLWVLLLGVLSHEIPTGSPDSVVVWLLDVDFNPSSSS